VTATPVPRAHARMAALSESGRGFEAVEGFEAVRPGRLTEDGPAPGRLDRAARR